MMYMSSSRIFLIGLVVIVLLAAAATWYVVQRNQGPSDIEQTLISGDADGGTSFSTVSGDPVALDETLQRDMPVVVMVWASWCPSCAGQLQNLQQIAVEYTDQLTVLAINRDEPRVRAQRYLDTVGDISAVTVLLNAGDRYYDDISGYAMPETVVYDQSGNLVERFRGDVSLAALQQAVEALTNDDS